MLYVGFAASRSASAINPRRGVHVSNERVAAIAADIARRRRVKAAEVSSQLELAEALDAQLITLEAFNIL